MTREELQSINGRVHERLQAERLPRLLLCALDRDLLSDDEHQRMLAGNFTEENLLGNPWVLALVWARLFYENSHGDDYRKVLTDKLSVRADEALRRIHADCGWFPPQDDLLLKNTHRFQSECWITGRDGHASKLWKCLPKVIRKTSVTTPDEDICCIDGFDEEDVPPPIMWLLQNTDPDFCRSIRCLLGYDQGLVGKLLKGNPVWNSKNTEDDFSPSLGIGLFDGRPELMLRIRNIWLADKEPNRSCLLEIRQNRLKVYQTTISADSPTQYVKISRLPESFNLHEQFEIRLNRTAETEKGIKWDLDDLIVFRGSEGGRFCRQLDGVEKELVRLQGRDIYVASRPGANETPEIYLGHRLLPAQCYGEISYKGTARKLHKYDCGLAEEQNRELREGGPDGRILAHLGRRPYLNVTAPDGWWAGWQCPGDEETKVVVGAVELRITAHNFMGENVEWGLSAEQGAPDQDFTLQPGPQPNCTQILRVTPPRGWGRRVTLTARTEAQREVARMRLLFVPAVGGPGVVWTSQRQQDDAFPLTSFARAQGLGLELGTLSWPAGVPMQLLKPIDTPAWGWRESAWAPLQDFNGVKNFGNHADVANWQLECSLPKAGDWRLVFNGEEVATESGSRTLQHLLQELIGPEQLRGDDLGREDTLVIRGQGVEDIPVATISRRPTHPVIGLVDGVPSIYIPEIASAQHFRLLLCRESAAFTDSLSMVDLADCRSGQIQGLDNLREQLPNEGAWLLLVRSDAPVPTTLRLFASLVEEIAIIGVCQISPEGEQQTFLQLMEQWRGQALTDLEKSQARTTLDLLDNLLRQMLGRVPAGSLLARARRSRNLLGYGNRNSLEDYFHGRLLAALAAPAPEDIEDSELFRLLSLLLECGFNWLAEPGWIESLCDKTKGLLAEQQPRRRFTRNIANYLKEACPLVDPFQRIHDGQRNGIRYISDDLFNLGPDAGLSLACPGSQVPAYQNGISFRGISALGIRLEGYGDREILWPARFQDPVEVRDTLHHYHPIRLLVTAPERAADYLEDKLRVRGHDNLVVPQAERERISGLFVGCLEQCSRLLGELEGGNPANRNLGCLLKTCGNHFERMANDEDGQECRAVIYESAVISRLYAWRGYAGVQDDHWPLNNAADYDAVCSLVSRAWAQAPFRQSLIKDLVPVEWLLTWFKNAP